MRTFLRYVFGTLVFCTCYIYLTFTVALMYNKEGRGGRPLDTDRFHVLVQLRDQTDDKSARFVLTQMRNLSRATSKADSHAFLLPPGTRTVDIGEGETATYTAESIGPDRQRIALRAPVGDYSYELEYEVHGVNVSPTMSTYTGPQMGAVTMPLSALVTWLAILLFGVLERRIWPPRARVETQPDR